jgi:hypothetical protein
MTHKDKRKRNRNLPTHRAIDVIARAALPRCADGDAVSYMKHVCTMQNDQDIVIIEKHADEHFVKGPFHGHEWIV